MPAVPTIAEGGVKGYDTGLWTGLLAPAGTPPQIIAQLNAAVIESLASNDMKATLAKQGAEPTGGTPQQFAEEIKREFQLWKDVAQRTGIKID